jgi:hypothetical protein
MSVNALTAGIYTKLTSITTTGSVYALTTGRIYHGQAPLDAALPYVTFFTVAHDPGAVNFGSRDIDADIQVDVYGDAELGRGAILTISDKLVTDFDHSTLTITGHGGARLDCKDPGVVETDGEALRVIQTWRVTATKTA